MWQYEPVPYILGPEYSLQLSHTHYIMQLSFDNVPS